MIIIFNKHFRRKLRCFCCHHGVRCRISWFWHSHAWLLLMFLCDSPFSPDPHLKEFLFDIFQKLNMGMLRRCLFKLRSLVESRNPRNLRETGTCVTLLQKVTPHVLSPCFVLCKCFSPILCIKFLWSIKHILFPHLCNHICHSFGFGISCSY